MCKEIYKILLICFSLFSSTIYGNEPRIVIIYPAINASQKNLYAQVIEGIEDKVGTTELLEIKEEASDFQTYLNETHPDKIIALGKKAAKAVSKSTYRETSIIGMTYFRASEYNGVGLALDSRVLIAHLLHLAPFIKRVFIIQDSSLQTIDIASNSARSAPTLIMREGSDIIETIRLLGNTVEKEARPTDAVFIPANLPKNILYEIARIAWDKNIILMSTNLAHLDNGALMAFYPDDTVLGEQLGNMVIKKKPSYESVKGINAALNKRVAQHLNIDFDQPTLDLFKLILK